MSFGSDLDERIRLLRRHLALQHRDDEELARIAAVAVPREAEVGVALTMQGDEGSEFFVIVAGDASAAVDGDEVGTIGPAGSSARWR